jgi:hypothetical protein
MKATIIGLLTSALLCSIAANAQEVLQLKFTAKCQSTNDAGRLIKENVNNKTILQAYADQNGITNLNSLALVYAVNGDERGDVIQVVDAYTGAALSHIYGLFFAVDLPTVEDGSRFSRFAYMFNTQQSYEMGSALLSERIKIDKQGNTNRTVNGNIQFYLTPDGTNGLRLCSGTISAGKAFTLSPTNSPSTNSLPTVRQR